MGRITVPTKTRVAPAPPAKVSSPPVYAPTLGQSLKDGFGLGFGSAIAQRMVSGIFGAPTIQTVPAKAEPTAFEQCVAEHRDDVAICAHLAQNKNSQ
jgi:hypothetical protein